MKAKIAISLNGEIRIITKEGSFETGSDKIEKLIELLNLDGLNIKLDGAIEQHRHDEPEKLYEYQGYIHNH